MFAKHQRAVCVCTIVQRASIVPNSIVARVPLEAPPVPIQLSHLTTIPIALSAGVALNDAESETKEEK